MQVTTKDWIHLTKPETTGIDPYDLESREKLKDPKERRTNEFAGILRHQFLCHVQLFFELQLTTTFYLNLLYYINMFFIYFLP